MTSPTLDESEFDSIPDAIQAFRDGEFIVVLDAPDRENEADLIIAAEAITTEQMAFLIRHTSGFVCAPLTPARAAALALPQMVPPAANADARGTAYTVSVDAAHAALTTGISAHDRALTCRALALADPDHPAAAAAAFRRPGHVLPLRAAPGGVRARRGHTEAAAEFCRLAARRPAAVICELVDDGEAVPGRALRRAPGMLRGAACVAFARRFGLRVCTIADLVEYVERVDGKLETNGSA